MSAEFPIEITQFESTAVEGRWSAKVTIPGERHASKVLIQQVGEDYIMFSAYCPHQAYDLSDEPLNHGKIICPLHGLIIDLQHGRSRRFCVKREGDKFVVTGPGK